MNKVDECLGLPKQQNFKDRAKEQKPEVTEPVTPSLSAEKAPPLDESKKIDSQNSTTQFIPESPSVQMRSQDQSEDATATKPEVEEGKTVEAPPRKQTSSSKLAMENERGTTGRESDAPTCCDLEEAIHTAKEKTSLIAISLITSESLVEIAKHAPTILGDSDLMVLIARRSRTPSDFAAVVNAIVPQSGTVLAGTNFRGGVNEAFCRFVGLRGDLSKLTAKNGAIIAEAEPKAEPPRQLGSSKKQLEDGILGFLTDDKFTRLGEIIEKFKDKYKPAAIKDVLDQMTKAKRIFPNAGKKKDLGYSLKPMEVPPPIAEVEKASTSDSGTDSEPEPTVNINIQKQIEERTV